MRKSELDILGIPVVEQCNLNCKGCLHFCHRGQEPHFYLLTEFVNDLKRMHEYFEHIKVIRLYGGEPFLHKDLDQFIICTHKEFFDASIEILTNGLLICEMTEKLIDTIRKHRAKISWSVYPIMTSEQVHKICNFMKEHDLIFGINPVDEFYACFKVNGNIPMENAYEKCSGKYCHMLRNGKISVCPAPFAGKYINELGGKVDFTDGILDIYQDLTADEIMEFLYAPHNVCRYCAPPRYFPWELQQEPVTLEDWCV